MPLTMYQNEPFEKMYQNLLTNCFECAIIAVSKRTKVRFNTKERQKMKQYGYARVSTKKQNIERQIRNIKNE